MNRRESLRALSLGAIALVLADKSLLAAAPKPRMRIYKSPTCGCCKEWVKHVKNGGFDVDVVDVDDVTPFKTKYGVPTDLQSCHTGIVDGYVFEGHVPVDLVKKVLREKPKAIGLAVPGMPMGSPGMEMGAHKEAYNVMLFDRAGKTKIYAKR